MVVVEAGAAVVVVVVVVAMGAVVRPQQGQPILQDSRLNLPLRRVSHANHNRPGAVPSAASSTTGTSLPARCHTNTTASESNGARTARQRRRRAA
jgi:hypothetical protein